MNFSAVLKESLPVGLTLKNGVQRTSVASRSVHVRKKHVLIGCKQDMFCRQKIEVWSRLLLST